MRNKLKEVITQIFIFCIMGSIYLNIEVFSRWLAGDLIGIHNIKRMTFAGWTSLWMFPIGGTICIMLGYLNEVNFIRKIPMLFQTLIGLVIVLLVEYGTGYILNVKLELYVWDYSDKFLNLHGQICLVNSIGFFFIIPFAFWLDDFIRSYVYLMRENYPLSSYYIELFTFNKFSVVNDIRRYIIYKRSK